MFSQVSVCPEGEYLWSHILSGEVGMSKWCWAPSPPDMGPEWVRIPEGAYPPQPRHGIAWDTVGKQVVRILLECFLAAIVHS